MIGIAAVFGAISIFAADFWVKSQAKAQPEVKVVSVAAPQPKVEFKTIVVAQAPLRYGMELARPQLAEIPWPQDSLPQGAFPTIDKLLADGTRVVLSPIEVNEPVLLTKLSGPNGRATLSNLLSPGMRAVTIRTDEIAGVGGFVTPGDRVDVVLTRDAGDIQEVSKNAQGAAGSTVTSEIVVSDAKVLSVGQGADERKTEPQVANSVTIEVTNEGAQKVALARTVGTLSLSLRSAADASTSNGGLTTISSFGGSVAAKAQASAASLVSAVTTESDEPKFKTVIVTRGEKVEEYKVPSREPPQELQQ
ncbi:Flp pilus assembly protein CpaB [Mesorhizobium sp. LCM 4577]|uniref:Flp pilus assembly protein CpaB n=1 Tax=unclassified Mesorhizobium TaxID=325217 RepID=UPI0008DAC625|nr:MULTISPECIES: Flp pilus assembly protein CpaB [unclassified Mesorhizobium]OHV68030.1 Flp pilus assembly protein CpaB [Mesorhizobium sp. LCM 4577]OHV71693.1 Flp pilus assembly protein CpaB [Mesorhizobium sp. LCM 4576]